ncbi:MAG: multiheme c-type cytochrome, partial [Planctomycetota bacterium]
MHSRPMSGCRSYLLRATAGVLAVVLAACGGGPAELAPSDLRVLFNASLNGYIEPCGCVVGKTGGVDRIVERVEAHRAAHPRTVFLEGGDLFAEDPELGANERDQLPVKAEALFELWARLGCQAMALGDLDLQLGVETLQGLAAEHGIPILCGNLVDADGERPFPATHEFEIEGQRIGVFSVLSPKLLAAGSKDTRTFDVKRTVEGLGYTLTDWHEAAAQAVAELRPRVDTLIALTHLGVVRNRRLASSHPEIDLIISPHEDNAEGALEIVSGVPIAVSTIRGSRLGRVDLWRPKGLAPGDPRPAWDDASDRIWPEVNLATVERGLSMIVGREASMGSAEFRTRRDAMTAERLQNARAVRDRAPIPETGAVSYVGEPLPLTARRSELALDAIDEYHAAVHSHWTGDGLAARHPTRAYVGAKACYECHTEQYEFWLATPHSHAFATLEATQQHVDAECIQCHTVGYRQPGGFSKPHQHPGFENVQCAACHGPGGKHVVGDESFVRPHLVPTPGAVCTG